MIRDVRRRQGLTQAQLAHRAGTTQPVISAYEHGRRDPGSEMLRKLVEAAGERLRIDAVPDGPDLPPPADVEELCDYILERTVTEQASHDDIAVLAVSDPSGLKPAAIGSFHALRASADELLFGSRQRAPSCWGRWSSTTTGCSRRPQD